MSAAVGRGPGGAAHPPARRPAPPSSPCATPTSTCRLVGRDPRQRPRRDGRAARRGRPGGGAGQADVLDPARHPACSTPGRSARWASASCWPGSSTSSGCWPPRGCSTRDRKGRCRSCPAGSGWSAAGRSAAEQDVVENARRRWPAVRFEIREVAVQGPDRRRRGHAPPCASSTPTPSVDVIVISPRRRRRRGPAAVQQRDARAGRRRRAAPPWSAPSATRSTPRCSTSSPTSAPRPRPTPPSGSCPTLAERAPRVQQAARDAPRRAVAAPGRQRAAPPGRAAQPAGAWPTRPPCCAARREELEALTAPRPAPGQAGVHRAADQIEHLRAQVRALSPLSTLDRGYAVVQHADGRVVMDQAERRGRASCCGCGSPAGTSARPCRGAALGWPPCRKRTEDTDGTADTGAAVTTGRRDGVPGHRRADLRGRPATSSSTSSPSSRAARPASRRAWRLWQRGEALAAHCSTWLDGAEATLTAGGRRLARRPTGRARPRYGWTGFRASAKAASSSNGRRARDEGREAVGRRLLVDSRLRCILGLRSYFIHVRPAASSSPVWRARLVCASIQPRVAPCVCSSAT